MHGNAPPLRRRAVRPRWRTDLDRRATRAPGRPYSTSSAHAAVRHRGRLPRSRGRQAPLRRRARLSRLTRRHGLRARDPRDRRSRRRLQSARSRARGSRRSRARCAGSSTCATRACALPWCRRAPTPATCCGAPHTDLFETTVDGRDLVRLDLNGKPAPDGFPRRPAGCGYCPGAPWSSRMPLPASRRDAPAPSGSCSASPAAPSPMRCAPPAPTWSSRTSGRCWHEPARAIRGRPTAGGSRRTARPREGPAHESVFAVANGYLGVRGTPRRAPLRTRPASRSTASTRAGRSNTRRTPTASPAPARRSCRRPDSSVIRPFVDDEPFEPHDRPAASSSARSTCAPAS